MDASPEPETMGNSPKKERLILAAGLTLCAALLTAHYFSGMARKLAANRDVEVALLSDGAKMVFVYHPFSKTVTAITLPYYKIKNRGSNYQRACATLAVVSGRLPGPADDVFYFSAAGAKPDLDGFYDILNSWRARPMLFFRAARGLWRLKKEERTNISFYDLAALALELSRLSSSNFIVADLDGGLAQNQVSREQAGAEEQREEPGKEQKAPVRVEVLNASGKKDLAARATKFLRKKGFDVINFETYNGAGRQTKIVNCSSNMEAARAVRGFLGLNALEIHSKPGPGNAADVSVVLGADFNDAIIKD